VNTLFWSLVLRFRLGRFVARFRSPPLARLSNGVVVNLKTGAIVADVYSANSHRLAGFRRVYPILIKVNRSDARNGAVRAAERYFDLVELFVPSRIGREEIGDAMDVINRLANDPNGSRWKVRLKIVSTIFWVIVNAIRHVLFGARGKAE
jgi:hypothetical protein